MDEIISLNALGLSIKKSLGSALKLYDKNNPFGTLFLYAAIVTLSILYPMDLAIIYSTIDIFLDMKW